MWFQRIGLQRPHTPQNSTSMFNPTQQPVRFCFFLFLLVADIYVSVFCVCVCVLCARSIPLLVAFSPKESELREVLFISHGRRDQLTARSHLINLIIDAFLHSSCNQWVTVYNLVCCSVFIIIDNNGLWILIFYEFTYAGF